MLNLSLGVIIGILLSIVAILASKKPYISEITQEKALEMQQKAIAPKMAQIIKRDNAIKKVLEHD